MVIDSLRPCVCGQAVDRRFAVADEQVEFFLGDMFLPSGVGR